MKLTSILFLSTMGLILATVTPSAFSKEQKVYSRHVVVGSVNAHPVGHSNHRRYKPHHSHHRHNHTNWGIVIGTGIGFHGAWYNGYPWCATHGVYHFHNYGHENYSDLPKKIDSYLEQDDEGRCFKVTEFSNGDVRKKRIRDHYCDEAIDNDDWDDEP